MMHIIVNQRNIENSRLDTEQGFNALFGKPTVTIIDSALNKSVTLYDAENGIDYRAALPALNGSADIMMFFAERDIPFEVMDVI